MSILEAEKITKKFKVDNKYIEILKGINLKIDKGEFVAIKGSSGSGKSTFLNIIAGLDKPTTGKIKLLNKDITYSKEEELSKLRNKDIGFVFQSFYLIPSLSVYENIILPSEISKETNHKRVLELIEEVGISNRKNSYPIQLSGGEKQRVAIARALVNKPKILFADEPTGNLDSENSEKIIELLIKLQKEYDLTLILVTHEKQISDKASRVIEIKDGKIINDIKQK